MQEAWEFAFLNYIKMSTFRTGFSEKQASNKFGEPLRLFAWEAEALVNSKSIQTVILSLFNCHLPQTSTKSS
jgi:hypothetical protein